MWRNPLAYGHATATRIFLGDFARLTVANDKESLSRYPSSSESPEEQHACERACDEDGEARVRRGRGRALRFGVTW